MGLDRLAGDPASSSNSVGYSSRGDFFVTVRIAMSLLLKYLGCGAEAYLCDDRSTRRRPHAVRAATASDDYDALAPTIDEQTMRIHHDKHHQAYVDNLNKALDGTEWADRPIEQVLALLDELPEDRRAAVRNNGGGHANHSLFWTIMKAGGGGDPSGALADAINDTFGGADQLRAQINDAGVKRFGSGWTCDVDGTGLAVVSTPNQDTPLRRATCHCSASTSGHAYYLNYQGRRPDYLSAWWNVVSWDGVAGAGARGG